ncbi:MAG: pyridoxamine 5'-phosphate oxidase family protein [Bacillota bacterium]
MMFREMRRKDRQADEATIDKLITNGEYGIISTTGENGYAYGVPVNFVYSDGSIYFHCAKDGQKLDNINYNNKVCFTIVGATKVLPDKFSTVYDSVIVFAKAYIVDDENEANEALKKLIEKYSPDFLNEGLEYIARSARHTAVVKLEIVRVTGKSREE